MNRESYDYGLCQVCGQQMVEREISQEFRIKDNLIVIENVPTGVCLRCGEKVVKADVGQQIASLLTDTKPVQPVRSILVPVLEFKQAA